MKRRRKLIPKTVKKPSKLEIQNAINEIRRLRKGVTLGDMTIKEMIEEKRKY